MGNQVTISQELPLMRTYKFIKLSRFQQQSLIRWKWNFQHHWAQSGPEGTEQAACAGNSDFYDTHHCYTSACHSEERGKKKILSQFMDESALCVDASWDGRQLRYNFLNRQFKISLFWTRWLFHGLLWVILLVYQHPLWHALIHFSQTVARVSL